MLLTLISFAFLMSGAASTVSHLQLFFAVLLIEICPYIIILTQSIDLSGCGSTKGCLRYPKGCTGADCEYLAAWADGTATTSITIEIQLQRSGDVWLAFGLSKTGKMVINGIRVDND
jgi:hypothetical protein